VQGNAAGGYLFTLTSALAADLDGITLAASDHPRDAA
jgi:hypothetical protein